jgi:hypothetical protein
LHRLIGNSSISKAVLEKVETALALEDALQRIAEGATEIDLSDENIGDGGVKRLMAAVVGSKVTRLK